MHRQKSSQLVANRRAFVQSLCSTNPMPIERGPTPKRPHHIYICSNTQNKIDMDRHALTQATPIYGQSEATSVSNRGTSVLQGDLPKCLDGGRFGWSNMPIHRPDPANPVPIYPNPMSIWCQSYANLSPIGFQSSLNPFQYCANPVPILNQYQSWANILIHYQFFNPMPILVNQIKPKRSIQSRTLIKPK